MDFNTLFKDFEKQNIMIIGDVMVDSYIYGKVDRISPEAPVPIVLVENRKNMLGGAANVALNIKALGATPYLVSLVGNDEKGREIIDIMNEAAIEQSGIVISEYRKTTTKYRVIGNNTQLLRIDEEQTCDANDWETEKLIQIIENKIKNCDIKAVILQDYNKGVMTKKIVKKIITIAKSNGIMVMVDPKKRNFNIYKGVSLFKPNFKELCEGIGVEVDKVDTDNISAIASEFQVVNAIETIMVTLSEKGIYVRTKINNNYEEFIEPAHVRKIIDVSGAGDTVISVASLCLSLNISPQITAILSNLAGGLVCECVGVAPIDKNRLLNESLKLNIK